MRRRGLNSSVKLINRTQIRVRFSEVDSMAIVWHGEYVRYFEDGREAFGREFEGLGYMDIYASGYAAPMVEMELKYKYPLRCNDTATVETRYVESEAAKIIFEYVIRRDSDGVVVATGLSTQVFIDPDGTLQLNSPEFYQNWKARWIEG
ncbi:MAG: acyl-CoA thioesterase [Rikenellaceae bacterium]